MGLIRSR